MARKTTRRQFVGGLVGATVALSPLPADGKPAPLPCGLKELPKRPYGIVVEERMVWLHPYENRPVRIGYHFFPLDQEDRARSYAKALTYTEDLRTVTGTCHLVYINQTDRS